VHRDKLLYNKNQLDALISQIYSDMKLYMFRRVPLSIIRSLFTVHSAMVYVIQVCRQLSTNLYDIPLLSVQWINSWWWTEELSETCRVSCQNKFVKLVHLVCFIIMNWVLDISLTDTNQWMLFRDSPCLFWESYKTQKHNVWQNSVYHIPNLRATCNFRDASRG